MFDRCLATFKAQDNNHLPQESSFCIMYCEEASARLKISLQLQSLCVKTCNRVLLQVQLTGSGRLYLKGLQHSVIFKRIMSITSSDKSMLYNSGIQSLLPLHGLLSIAGTRGANAVFLNSFEHFHANDTTGHCSYSRREKKNNNNKENHKKRKQKWQEKKGTFSPLSSNPV